MVAVRHAMAIEFQQDPPDVLECGSAKAGVLNPTIPRLSKREVSSLRLGSKSVVMERYTGPKKANPLLWYVGMAHHSLMYVHYKEV